MPSSRIVATGSYLPAREVLNADLTQFPPIARSLIESKTGVKSRRHAAPDQCTSDLAIEASRQCLARANVRPSDLDAIILATSSPDRIQPATATTVQHEIGATRAFAFDVNSVCSGAVYAIAIADAFIRAEMAEKVLVVAAELYSRFLDPRDFSTFPYFGDGAGAVLLQATGAAPGIVHTTLHADGSGSGLIQIPAGGTKLPVAEADARLRYFSMRGAEVFEFAVLRGSEVIREILALTGVKPHEVAWVISHQANRNVILEIARRAGIDAGRFLINLDRIGNTAAASVLIALDELVRSNALRENDAVVLVVFGGGLSWGATLVRWREVVL